MKIPKVLFALMALVLFTVTSCSKDIDDEAQKMVIQKSVGNNDEYEDYKIVEENRKVDQVKQILHQINWENAQVSMSRPPDYQLFFQFKNPNIMAKAVLYRIWISPNKEQLEIVKGESQYAQLTKEDSANLFQLITGNQLK